MELYEQARGDLFPGKKILYVHGFASSGESGTVGRLRLLLPAATIVAPDVPVDPFEAREMLRKLCAKESPDLVIGTSMGAMYTEQLAGYDRICVNPALHLADTLLKNNGLGRQEFHNPRKDGQTSFMVTKALLEAYREVSDGRFSQVEPDRVYGLFGTRDTLVDCFDEFAARYPRSLHFDGGHQLNDHAILGEMLGTTMAMSEGELMQSIVVDCVPQSEKTTQYLDIITRKTAMLMRSCCVAGALSVGATPEQVQQIADFGLHFGILFQLRDDLLDGENTEMAQALLPTYLNKTLKALEGFPPTETLQALRELTTFCAEREG